MSRGADARQKNLERKWAGLETRAEDRRQGKDPLSRRQRKRQRQQTTVTLQSSPDQQLGSTTTAAAAEADKVLKLSTQFVSDKTDLGQLVAEQFAELPCSRLGIVGLHTCGNLAASSLRIFLASESVRFICNVGCCYHALDEEFYRNPYIPLEDATAQTTPGNERENRITKNVCNIFSLYYIFV